MSLQQAVTEQDQAIGRRGREQERERRVDAVQCAARIFGVGVQRQDSARAAPGSGSACGGASVDVHAIAEVAGGGIDLAGGIDDGSAPDAVTRALGGADGQGIRQAGYVADLDRGSRRRGPDHRSARQAHVAHPQFGYAGRYRPHFSELIDSGVRIGDVVLRAGRGRGGGYQVHVQDSIHNGQRQIRRGDIGCIARHESCSS